MADDDNCRMFDVPAAPSPALAFDGMVALTDWGVIRARGPEAAAFLNGQLTQELLHLDPCQARLAGYCSP